MLKKAFSDLFPDFISLAGLCLLGYGLHMWRPWTAFVVCGALLIAAGARMAR